MYVRVVQDGENEMSTMRLEELANSTRVDLEDAVRIEVTSDTLIEFTVPPLSAGSYKLLLSFNGGYTWEPQVCFRRCSQSIEVIC